MPRSTIHRLLATIVNAGFLDRTRRGEYAVSIGLWRIGASAISQRAMHDEIRVALQRLVDETEETAHYSIYERGMAVYVEKIDGTHPVRAYTFVGGRSPAYASATGKALLAAQAEEEVARVAAGIERFTPTTLAPDALAREMEAVRTRGYAVNRGEWREGVWGVAAPVFDRAGALVGAIGVSGPEERIEAALPEFGPLIRSRAAALTERHGGDAARDNGQEVG